MKQITGSLLLVWLLHQIRQQLYPIYTSVKGNWAGLFPPWFFLPLQFKDRRMQTLTQAKNLLMGHLLAALRQALLSARLAPEEFYMTKAVRRLMRQVSTSEENNPHIKQGKIKWAANSLKQTKKTLKGFPSSEKLFKRFGESMNICAFWGLLEVLEVVLSSSSQGNACASLTLEQPDVLSWNAFSFFLKQINHVRDVVAEARSERWEEGIFRSPAVPTRTRSLTSYHKKFHFLSLSEMSFSPNTQKKCSLWPRSGL